MLHTVSQNPWLLGDQLMWRYDLDKLNVGIIAMTGMVLVDK